VKEVKPHGVAELMDPDSEDTKRSWVVNGKRLKPYMRCEIHSLTIVHYLDDSSSESICPTSRPNSPNEEK